MQPLLFLLAFIAAGPAALRIEPNADGTQVKVVARFPQSARAPIPEGKLSSDEGERWLRFALIADNGVVGEPILGTYERQKNLLIFIPRFALAHGQRYRATLSINDKNAIQVEHRVAARPTSPAVIVDRIYPTADELPANLLKFYIHFSKPMREGRTIFDQIHLLDADGKLVEDPWRRTELWNDDATRLTLWIHPGRIKEGVNLRDEFGPVLEPNRQYTLVIGAKLLDADGQPLGKPFRKTFRTTPVMQKAIDLNNWQVKPPKAGSTEALEVRFPRPLDRALLDRFLTVTDAAGKEIAGRIVVGKEERLWTFQPKEPWRAGRFTLTVDERLEDLSGNTLLRPFDLNRKLPEVKDPRRTIGFMVDRTR